MELDIVDPEEGFYVVRFFSRDDYHFALENGPWTIQGHYLNLSKLWLRVLTSSTQISSTLVWVRLPRLPLEFFNEAVLVCTGDCLGTAVTIDGNTMNVSHGKYARICIEVDLQKPLTSLLILNGKPIKVEYESLYQICFTCGQYGHRQEDCPTCYHAGANTVIYGAEISMASEIPSDLFGPGCLHGIQAEGA